MKPVYFLTGWVFVALGVIGAFLPAMPTTIFMLLALGCFAKSSPRFHGWLYHHRVFGPSLQLWEQHHVIPRTAKIISITMMSGSLVYIVFFTQQPVYVSIIAGLVMLYGAWFILSKPSVIPKSS